MSVRSIPRIVLVMLGVMIAADLVGVAASFILDVAPARHKSAGLGYAIWLVLGVFAGIVAFGSAAGDATAGRRVGQLRVVLAVAFLLVGLLSAAFTALYWRAGTGEAFAVVPDHMPTTLVFFVAFLAACVLAYRLAAEEAAAAGRSAPANDA